MSSGQRNRIRAQAGDSPLELNSLNMLRTVRTEAGRQYLDRDIVATLRAEEPEPGRRYDTVHRLSAGGSSAFSFGSLSRACDGLPAVTGLEPVPWPSAPIRTERLVLHESEARDRAAFIELFASPEAGAYTDGPRPRDAPRGEAGVHRGGAVRGG
ncbi:hypothetical protein GCM10010405_43980 [Streptomyces macrosporus]|uniref:Uncharacterized protein n=1 Tax=Streptomyces macrosporus TaxID=44032 RepID=A0ABP5XG93_9ACTN